MLYTFSITTGTSGVTGFSPSPSATAALVIVFPRSSYTIVYSTVIVALAPGASLSNVTCVPLLIPLAPSIFVILACPAAFI